MFSLCFDHGYFCDPRMSYTRVVRYYKLQNGAISLILKIGKIQNIRFVGNLIL